MGEDFSFNLEASLTMGHSPRQGPWSVDRWVEQVEKGDEFLQREPLAFPEGGPGSWKEALLHLQRSSRGGQSLLGAQKGRECASPRNVFTLEKVSFDLAPKEARKGHRVLWILVCRGSATRSPGHVGGVVAESDRREGGKGMGWAGRKIHRELCGKWECKGKGPHRGCEHTAGEEKVDLAAPRTWGEQWRQCSSVVWVNESALP